jgi:hypothetical protein
MKLTLTLSDGAGRQIVALNVPLPVGEALLTDSEYLERFVEPFIPGLRIDALLLAGYAQNAANGAETAWSTPN